MELSRPRRLLVRALCVSTLLLGACNSLTGADDLEIVGAADDFAGDGGLGGDGGGGPGGNGGGPGHTTSAGPGGSTQGGSAGEGGSAQGGSAGVGGSAQGGSAGVGGGSTSSGAGGSTGSGPVNCVYPSGASGIQSGDLVDGSLSWQGYGEKASQSGALSIQDFFDCDGSRGINALLIDNSATWCGACQEEATDLPSHTSEFASKGIRVLTLMVENINGQPASLATATQWRDNFGLGAYSTAADPDFTFAGSGSVGLPLQIIVDPRTMKIVAREEGFGDYTTLLQLAAKNAN